MQAARHLRTLGSTWVGTLVLALVATAGCAGGEGRVPVYPVEGKVTVAGEIPAGALVVLHPVAESSAIDHRPSGRVEGDGTFRLTTFEAEDGAPAGEYVATIQWNRVVKRGGDYVAGADVAPTVYTRAETSPWKVRVAEATRLAPVDLTRK